MTDPNLAQNYSVGSENDESEKSGKELNWNYDSDGPHFSDWSDDSHRKSSIEDPTDDLSSFDFNNTFQELIEAMRRVPEGYSEQRLKISQDLIRLSNDFLKSARRYGKIIISEVYRANKFKTIKPKNVGGVIGGEV